MTGFDALPVSAPDKLAFLRAAAAVGDRLQPLLERGTPVRRLQDHVAASDGLTIRPDGHGLVVALGPWVDWRVTVDDAGRIQGHGFSGFDVLMTALGIDFAGRPYGEGGAA